MSRNRHPKVNAYKLANEEFLQRKSTEEGVVALDNGVLMQKLSSTEGENLPALIKIAQL